MATGVSDNGWNLLYYKNEHIFRNVLLSFGENSKVDRERQRGVEGRDWEVKGSQSIKES